MLGEAVRVLTNHDDAVRPRQGLIVIEDMRMDSELRAARDGTVTAVDAWEATSVEAGTLLVVIA